METNGWAAVGRVLEIWCRVARLAGCGELWLGCPDPPAPNWVLLGGVGEMNGRRSEGGRFGNLIVLAIS